SLTITVNPAAGGNEPPVLAQPSNMTVSEGATDNQVITATDPNGDAISFSKQGGPAFMTVSTTTPGTGTGTGAINLAPGFADSGTYTATVRASDGSLNDDKTFTITVNNVNRAPVADAGGPYTGTVGSPVSFSGTGSSDPDGDALTYAWDFDVSDGITVDATGSTPSHTYSATGPYTVTLTVTDNGTPGLNDTDTATATISEAGAGVEANIFLSGGNRVIRFNSARPFWCVQIEPVDRSFNINNIIGSSIKATYGGVQIAALVAKTHQESDVNENGIAEFKACFSKESLRVLFASLLNGRRSVDVTITGDLAGGGSFSEVVSVVVIKGGNSGLAKGQEDDGEEHAEGHGNGKDFSHASPNPFNPNTTISFELSRPGSVRLHIYDVSGRLVKTLADGFMGEGAHSVAWDGTARNGSRVSSGVYFYVLDTPERSVKSQLVMMR
ncbi:MAG TPA: PKD domain-containing protein, partial [Candidatus Limnocylindrales bacterium]|nr:PKD domain-containing protein [Candidatus Limnocylindrales bacterium]